jgi:hypothetical protein
VETFIVRLWSPSPDLVDEVADDELHGSVDHLRARQSYRFQTGDGLVEILRLALDPSRKHPPEEGGKRYPTVD